MSKLRNVQNVNIAENSSSNILEDKSKNQPKNRNRYDSDFKAQVLAIWYSGAYATVVDCAKSYNIKENTLHTWLHSAQKKQIPIATNSDILNLKKELSRTKMELDILKKAAIYFANHAR